MQKKVNNLKPIEPSSSSNLNDFLRFFATMVNCRLHPQCLNTLAHIATTDYKYIYRLKAELRM